VTEGAPLSAEDLLAYIGRSHALVAKGLTKKLRAELGICEG
jgi:predicted DNA-binding protein (MmcQ/YjbR family)